MGLALYHPEKTAFLSEAGGFLKDSLSLGSGAREYDSRQPNLRIQLTKTSLEEKRMLEK